MSASIRNVAIIAHVDHGKTTLVDALLRQSGTFRPNEAIPERAMDTLDLERERGITIASKNCTIEWEGLTINIVDTPGHSDFGGEVERILSMVDGALLLVDAAEGPLPQTRFVLTKALAAGLDLVVVINKIDRKDARTFEVRNELFSLMIDCGAEDRHLEAPVLYAIARDGAATAEIGAAPRDMRPVFEAIRDRIPPPRVDAGAPFSMIVANLGWSDYVGRLAIGRVKSGSVRVGETVLLAGDGRGTRGRVTRIYGYRGLETVERDEAGAGEIVSVAGFDEVEIGDTLTSPETPVVQPRIRVEEPTVEMVFGPNTSPLAGREGKFVTGRQLGDRLRREGERNVSLRIRETEDGRFSVAGRGELQLAILIETMRREGFECEVSRPRVIEKEIDGVLCEPFESLVVDVAEEFLGAVTEVLSQRRGVMRRLEGVGTGRVRMEFRIPARGLIGVRSRFLTLTRGTGLLHAVFDGYDRPAGRIPSRTTGAMVSDRVCEATAYAIRNLEERGLLFVAPGTPCYGGMIVGEHAKEDEIEVYIGRPKKLTNVRAAGADEAILLTPPRVPTLETAMEWIADDELIEVTPASIRLRKRELDPSKRKAARRAEEAEG